MGETEGNGGDRAGRMRETRENGETEGEWRR
jgi:hypothetical protein